MPIIELKSEINSKIDICFDLARSIDLHLISAGKTNEMAIAGRKNGLINLGETVTWQATHFGIKQQLTSKITAFNKPYYFKDEQIHGIFEYLCHEHIFSNADNKTQMIDIFEFHSPLGILGTLVDKLILTNYLRKFLKDRNNVIKNFAESDQWKLILNEI